MTTAAVYNTINGVAATTMGHKPNILSISNRLNVFDFIISTQLEKVNVLRNSACQGVCLSLCVCSDPVATDTFVSNVRDNRINGVVFFHDYPQTTLKKEDLAIINHKLKDFHKITYNVNIQNSWPIEMSLSNPGLPNIEIYKNKTKSLVIMSSHHINQAKIMHKQILDVMPDAGLLINYESLESVSDVLNEYKVCISLDNYINTIFAVACGCSVISRYNYGHSNILTFNDSDSLNNCISQSFKSFDIDTNIHNAKELVSKYDINKFDSLFMQTMTDIIRKPFLL